MYYLSFLALVAAVSASSCPSVTPVKNFDFASYGQGIWYEVGRYPIDMEIGSNCGIASYTRIGDVVTVKNSYVINDNAAYIVGTARLAPNANGSGKVIHTLPYGAGRAFTDSLLNILAIDYDKYLIGYHCQYDEATKTHKDLAWILSRTKTLAPETKAEIENFVKNSKFLDFDKFIWPKFTNEACKSKTETSVKIDL